MGPLALGLALWVSAAPTATLTSEPAFLVSGSGRPVQLQLLVKDGSGAPALKARVEVSSSAGAVGPVENLGHGKYRVALAPPAEKLPQVSIVYADIEVGGAWRRVWVGVPVHGSSTLKLETKPAAQVEVTVADRTFGPVTADRRGRADLPVVVPPGVKKGSLRSVDHIGNVKVKPIDLAPPPYPRVRLVPALQGSATVTVGGSLELEAYGVESSGVPAPSVLLETAAERGAVTTPLAVAGVPGLFTLSYKAPEGAGAEAIKLRGWIKGDKSSAGTL
ncbi:MAG TPA: hypothetical protein VEY30_01075, partial [Myxococcaceae bacterium]|nr:hypothetical protein [Myxococcaceae bacterium]